MWTIIKVNYFVGFHDLLNYLSIKVLLYLLF